ncbi:DUF262 domain-containing protein [Rossellomorea vietnamensis]|uniref:DUF262 domain-containing protein n=1 Tax=Rossellomorea vietnamensis TaxID=218284 RepID=UPI001E4ABD70|nr:DUF262 domain-containing protein [Rossellomorea vietnamensis]MCC5803793.1 DUF262 domain-containing protein [Rossellomorea vietnamensis]
MFLTEQLAVKEVFKQYYTIPDFQRGYAWREQNVKELFSDLRDETDGFTLHADNTESQYFLGNIVLIGDETSKPFTVVDGQQRLTTLMLIFRAIEEQLHKRDIPDTRSHRRLLDDVQDIYGEWKNDESFNIRINYEFKEYINILQAIFTKGYYEETEENLKESERNVQEVYDTIVEELESLNDDQVIFLTKYLQSKTVLVVTKAKNMSVAYRVFETLNKRGKELDATDLIKNRLISIIVNEKEDMKDEFVSKWNQMIETLTDAKYKKDVVDTTKFLKHYIIGIYGENVSKSKIFDWFNKITKKMNSQDIMKMVDSLKECALLYADLHRGNYNAFSQSTSSEVQMTLGVFGYQQMYSLYMLFRKNSQEEKEKISRLILKFTSTLIFAKIQANVAEKLIEEYASDYINLSKNEDDNHLALNNFYKNITEQVQQYKLQAQKVIKEERFQDKNGKLHYRGNRLLKLLLLLTGNEKLMSRNIHVEHIMPQTLDKARYLSYGISDEAEFKDYVNRIGNLVPLEADLNSSGSNFTFEQKLQRYKESEINMTKRISDELSTVMRTGPKKETYLLLNDKTSAYSTWTKDQIEKRSEEISSLFAILIEKY